MDNYLFSIVLIESALFILFIVFSYLDKRQLQRTIDKLTDTTMDYYEHTQVKSHITTVRQEQEDKPMSWFDH